MGPLLRHRAGTPRGSSCRGPSPAQGAGLDDPPLDPCPGARGARRRGRAGRLGPCSEPTPPAALPAGAEANSVGRIGEGGGGIVSAAQVGSLPDAIAVGEGAVWVTDTTTGESSRGSTRRIARLVQTISVGSSPNAVAVGHGAVWVANGGDRTVSRVSPATNKEIATVTVGNGPSGVATDERWVWVTNRLDGTLARIDPRNDDVENFPIGTTPSGVATGAGSVWVSDFDLGTVVRVDPATGLSGAPIHVGNGPTSIAAAADQVWVVNSRDGTVSRIDPGTNAVVGDDHRGRPAGDGDRRSVRVGRGRIERGDRPDRPRDQHDRSTDPRPEPPSRDRPGRPRGLVHRPRRAAQSSRGHAYHRRWGRRHAHASRSSRPDRGRVGRAVPDQRRPGGAEARRRLRWIDRGT